MNNIKIELSRDEGLVLMDALDNFDDSPQRSVFDRATWIALRHLVGQLENHMVEQLHPDYELLIEAAKTRLTDDDEPL